MGYEAFLLFFILFLLNKFCKLQILYSASAAMQTPNSNKRRPNGTAQDRKDSIRLLLAQPDYQSAINEQPMGGNFVS